ncbi:Outer membrane protein assembly factor BamE, lipoprotein component of the BamABCDE complex [Marinobacter sp. es.048]|uniref:outer membrane protein assembly factor BamE n=1 Tax=Marinobacter sp. es.048 TaxID=1761795 RepID=UPI000B5897A5|nr:outer membrane protein assembly factor BamE [Marinobacter sp. es.048]SNC74815.1 Outer membrane protein assembly factor BamE, lipoprotein component of the BamABCDE complex [Marinobacter sp. es.048]
MNEKHVKLFCAVVLASIALSGCATSGGNQSAFSNAAEGVKEGVGAVAEGVGNAVGGLFQPYTNGVKVSDQDLDRLQSGMTSAEVEQILGFPPEINESNGQEIWSYPYTEIRHFGGNTNETTIVRFDTNGELVKAYKTNSRNSPTGNPLVDASNGVN